MTDLSHRMMLHIAGQLTWPEPELKATRQDCAHFAPRKQGDARGRCGLVRAHQKVEGVQFDAAKSTACPKIRRL